MPTGALRCGRWLSVAKVLGWTISPRRFVREGALSVLVGQEVAEVTSNPTISQGAIAEGDAYGDQLREVLRSETDPQEVFLAVVQRDIEDACDLLWEVFERGDSSRDGWVSLEVDPSLAHDTQATIDEVTRLHRMIDRPNLFVKIPGTEAGLSAIEESIARGIPVNVTLLFPCSATVQPPRLICGVAPFARGREGLAHRRLGDFLFRLSGRQRRRPPLEELGGYDELKGTLAVANAKLAYQTYKELFTGADWDDLVAAGASAQRCLWASTSVKDPGYRDVRYVEEARTRRAHLDQRMEQRSVIHHWINASELAQLQDSRYVSHYAVTGERRARCAPRESCRDRLAP
jgi:transaldolase